MTPPSRIFRPLVSPFAFAFLTVALFAPSVPAQSAGDRRAMFEQQRRQLEAFFQGQPRLDASRIDQVLRLHTLDGRLVAETPLTDKALLGTQQYRAELQGLGEGLTSIYIGRNRVLDAADGIVEVRTFSLTHYDFSSPGVLQTLSVQVLPSFINVEKQAQLPDGYLSVRLADQRPGRGAGADGNVQLTITQTNSVGRPQVINLTEPDFQSLIRRHPKEAQEFVRPLFRQLGQEWVFGPDPLVAWQVFSDRWTTDEPMRRRVERLLPRLNAGDFRARDKTLQQLVGLGRPAAAVLLRLDRSKFSAEQNLRIDRALRPYAQLPPGEATRLRTDVGFLIDCLYVGDAALRDIVLEQLRDLTGQDVALDPSADAVTRAAAIAALRDRLIPPPGQ